MTFTISHNLNQNKNVQTERLEILLIEVGSNQYALRAAHVMRLTKETSLQLRNDKTPSENPEAYIGYIRQIDLPVYDLALLMGESETGENQGNAQVILMNDPDVGEQAFGFRVSNTAEVVSVNLNELIALPEIVEYNKIKPFVWAFWCKINNENESEIISLIDPIAVVKAGQLI
jgi:chemotaxis signal transduction protein